MVLWKRSQWLLVCGVRALVRVCSMPFTSKVKLEIVSFQFAAAFRPFAGQDTDDPHVFCEAKKDKTWSFKRSAPVMGILEVYSLTVSHFE